MSEQFEREPRYVVFKIRDLQKYCSEFNIKQIRRIGEIVAEGRAGDGRLPLNAAVVEQDWPEFEMVLGAIETRMTRTALAAAPKQPAPLLSFQQRVRPWLLECFGETIAGDREERNHRFLEEALELVQACGCTQNEAHQLVDYVFGRPVGEPRQEVGGVMVTLAALCLANGLDVHADGEAELARISVPETVLKIRAKQAAKPKCSPLPETVPKEEADHA